MLSVFLDQFARGYSLTAWYQLLDNEGGFTNTYGMYTDASTPKVVATYLHNLTTILADSGNAFVPGTLDWSIASQPATVHSLLLQKQDGHLWLCLTDEHWPAQTDAITVSLGATFATVNVYDPTVGTNIQMSKSAVGEIALTMTDHPLFLEIF